MIDFATGLESAFTILAEARPWDRIQAGIRNRVSGNLANSVGAVLDARQSVIDFVEGGLLGGEQSQGKIMVEFVGCSIGHAQAELFMGFFGGKTVVAALGEEMRPEGQQTVAMFFPFGRNNGSFAPGAVRRGQNWSSRGGSIVLFCWLVCAHNSEEGQLSLHS